MTYFMRPQPRERAFGSWSTNEHQGGFVATTTLERIEMTHMPDEEGKELLDRAFEGLERETPDTITHILRWVRDPKSRWIRPRLISMAHR